MIHTINVTFKKKVHSIKVSSGDHGTTSPSGKVSIVNGANKTFKIIPKKGYTISSLKVDGVKVKVTNNTYTIKNVTKDHTINVTFMKK